MQRYDYDTLHLGCGKDYHDDAWNVDANPEVDPDQQYDLDDQNWPWPDESFRVIRAYHVFEHLKDMEKALRESARILEPGGRLILKLPMGSNAYADPGHLWGKRGLPWTWRTPEFYTGERHWDSDVGLELVDRDVSLHSTDAMIPVRIAHMARWWATLMAYGPGEWCFGLPNMGGEFTVVYRKP